MKALAKDSVEIISELTTAPRIEIEHVLSKMVKNKRNYTSHLQLQKAVYVRPSL